MQYSFERWARQKTKKTPQAQEQLAGGDTLSGLGLLGAAEPIADEAENPPEGLREAEHALPLALEEGMDAYFQHKEGNETGELANASGVQPMGPPPAQWDDLAKLVADHVLAALMENPLQDELERLKLTLNDAQRDNRVMARHIQKLILENHRLQGVLGEQGPPPSP